MVDDLQNTKDPISFAPRLVSSEGFKTLYAEGMGLIESVATYLDSEGRVQSRDLPREASLLYASESMRLTTRLMQLASWLLLQRAVNEGEITADHARGEKSKVKFSAEAARHGGPGWEELPQDFRDYVEKGDRLFARIKQIDAADRGEQLPSSTSPTVEADSVTSQMARLQQAFPRD